MILYLCVSVLLYLSLISLSCYRLKRLDPIGLRELGGIPNSSEDVKQSHASAIESYIEKYVGIDFEGDYRDAGDMGSVFFGRTLEDWAKFDITNRTKFDAAISSGLAIMANQKHLYTPSKQKSKISINFARYNNKSTQSKIIT